jgi:hypothetical protein
MKELSDSIRITQVFIFCGNKEYHLTWSKNYEKISAVENKFEIINAQLLSYFRIYSYGSQVYKQAFHFNTNEAYIEFINIDFLIQLVK